MKEGEEETEDGGNSNSRGREAGACTRNNSHCICPEYGGGVEKQRWIV